MIFFAVSGVEYERLAGRRVERLHVRLSTDERYTYSFTDECLVDHSSEYLAQRLEDDMIPASKKHPGKEILLKMDGEISVRELE